MKVSEAIVLRLLYENDELQEQWALQQGQQ
jgi:hypothetical protein